MSYDVEIAGEYFNYTYNLSPLFRTHMHGGVRSLDGLRGRSAVNALDRFFASVQIERDRIGQSGMKEKYDAPNGWGTFVGGMTFMLNIKTACEQYPRHKVRVT